MNAFPRPTAALRWLKAAVIMFGDPQTWDALAAIERRGYSQ